MAKKFSPNPSTLQQIKATATKMATDQPYGFVLDSCQEPIACHISRFDFMAGWGAKKIISAHEKKEFLAQLDNQIDNKWWFGFLGYDLKNEIEALHSLNKDTLQFPQALLFNPEVVITLKQNL